MLTSQKRPNFCVASFYSPLKIPNDYSSIRYPTKDIWHSIDRILRNHSRVLLSSCLTSPRGSSSSASLVLSLSRLTRGAQKAAVYEGPSKNKVVSIVAFNWVSVWIRGSSFHSSSPRWTQQRRTEWWWNSPQNETKLLWVSLSRPSWGKNPCGRLWWWWRSGRQAPCWSVMVLGCRVAEGKIHVLASRVKVFWAGCVWAANTWSVVSSVIPALILFCTSPRLSSNPSDLPCLLLCQWDCK